MHLVLKKNGFSLMELLSAMSIIGILMVISFPAFKSSNFNNRLASEANQLNSSFAFARSEAYRRNDYVSVCASNDLEECNSDDFSTGIIVFVNSGLAGLNNNNQIIRVYDKWQGDDKGKINVADGSDTFTFNAVPTVVSSGSVLVCSPGYNSYSVNVNTIGSLNIVSNVGDNAC